MSAPTLIYDLPRADLEQLVIEMDQPAYRAGQIWEGLYKHLWSSPDEFTPLSKSLRAILAEKFSFSALAPLKSVRSSDNRTVKTLFILHDKQVIEAVLMRYDRRRTLCISSQVGCAMGCVFCATGQIGFKRQLSNGEIVAQVLYYARMLKERDERVTNVVLMGMGEPFHNYENSMGAIDRLNDPEGFGLGARRFTVSTVGLVPQIKRFADEKRGVNLAISLHSADDETRGEIIPVNKKYDIKRVLEACRYYVEKTGRRVTFEWALIQGVNDSEVVARRLAARLKGLQCHVNAIPLNPTGGYQGTATGREDAARFKLILEEAGIPCTVRMRRGIDIQAGCGQLAGEA